jgi:hypothetical protein
MDLALCMEKRNIKRKIKPHHVLSISSEAGFTKNYCATNTGSPEVLFMDHFVQILN